MIYSTHAQGGIVCKHTCGKVTYLPAENNGTPEWTEYLAWLEEGNTPEPAPVPEPVPALTTEQKLEAAGLTVAELRELFGLPAPE
jgi:hypothetical protein